MITKSTLKNGIQVVSESISHSHSVAIGIWVTNGSRHDKRDMNGVAHFIEHLLFKGTKKRNALDIAREIDSVGGVLNAFTCREYVCYYAKVLNDSLSKVIELLSDIFLNSTFDPAEIEKERKVVLQEIRMLRDSPESYIHELFCQSFWKSHPLGMSIAGTEESVGRLSRDILLNSRNERFRTEDIIISAAGKVSHPELVTLLEALFADVEEGSCQKDPELPVCEKRVEIISKDLEQVHLCIGTKALPQDSPQRYVGYVLNTILGGSISSRLFQEVREEKGLAYSVYSYVLSHSDTGTLVVYAGTKQEKLLEVIDIILQQFRALKNEPITNAELEFAREHLKGNLLLSLESTDNRMTKLAKNEIYFGRQVSLSEIITALERVTSRDVMDLCRVMFRDEYLTLEVLGNFDAPSFLSSSLSL
jgi:predicted Zn-dependent peptidase